MMQTENQVKAEASRLFIMAMEATTKENRDRLLFARWALLGVLNERIPVSYCSIEQVGDMEIIAGSGPIEHQIIHFEMWQSGKYPQMAVCRSDRRLLRWIPVARNALTGRP